MSERSSLRNSTWYELIIWNQMIKKSAVGNGDWIKVVFDRRLIMP
jgi:hypothetical protein